MLQDEFKAARWYKEAAEQGLPEAQFNLGSKHASGKGVPQDKIEAARWYRMAANEGLAKAQVSLGAAYNRGYSVPQDFVTAHMWYNIAAGNGTAQASELRDYLADEMTAADISEAQRRARVCFNSGYQDCG